MIEEYCPCEEIYKLEKELWDLVMNEADIVAHMNRFNDLSTLCPKMVTPEDKKVENIWGLPRPIRGLVIASKPSMYGIAKRLPFSLKIQEILRGTMVQQVDLLRAEGKKRKFGKESKRMAK